MASIRKRLSSGQVAGIYRRDVGALRIATLHDGMLATSFDDVVHGDPKACEGMHKAEHRPVPPQFSCNSFVIDTSDEIVLIDAGCGMHMPDVGKAVNALAHLGISPSDIDAVLMTHMHQDHAGGLVTPEGEAIYPNAELVMHESEMAFWSDAANLPRLRKSQHFDFDIANKVFRAYANRIRTVKDAGVDRGMTAIAVPGHTPGHVAWLLESAGERLLIWGDVIHFPAFQFAHPEICVAYDFDKDAAAVSRKRLLDMVSTEKLAVAGVHLDFPSFGYVEKLSGGGYRYFSETWTSDIGGASKT